MTGVAPPCRSPPAGPPAWSATSAQQVLAIEYRPVARWSTTPGVPSGVARRPTTHGACYTSSTPKSPGASWRSRSKPASGSARIDHRSRGRRAGRSFDPTQPSATGNGPFSSWEGRLPRNLLRKDGDRCDTPGVDTISLRRACCLLHCFPSALARTPLPLHSRPTRRCSRWCRSISRPRWRKS